MRRESARGRPVATQARTRRAGPATAPTESAVNGAGGLATRERLLQSAIRLFSERGFEPVTVRDIVKDAGANVAAVNYHFAGKKGLYTEVVERAIAIMRSANDETRHAPPGSSAEEKLAHFIRTFTAIGSASPDVEWIQSLVRHEMERPTPAVRSVVKQVMGPRFRYLADVVSEMMETAADDERVMRCVLSVQAQVFFVQHMVRVKGRLRAAGFSEFTAMGTDDISAFADHIVRFSLAGIRNAANGEGP